MKVVPNNQMLKNALLENGLDYKGLGNKTDLSSVTISRIMNNLCGVSVQTANRIADALGKPVTELFTVE